MPRITVALATIALLGAASSANADEYNWYNSPKVLACSPKVLKPGAPMTLKLGPNHGAEMAIRRAGTKDWYFLVVGGTSPEEKVPMTPQAFKSATSVIVTVDPKGVISLNGNRSGSALPKPGRYTVYLADKLESETDGNICNFEYRR